MKTGDQNGIFRGQYDMYNFGSQGKPCTLQKTLT